MTVVVMVHLASYRAWQGLVGVELIGCTRIHAKKRVKVELILQWVNHVFSSPSAAVPGATPMTTHKSKESTTKNVGEDVIHPRATPSTFPQALFSISVVELLLFRVAQNLIGKTDFFKLLRQKRKKQT